MNPALVGRHRHDVPRRHLRSAGKFGKFGGNSSVCLPRLINSKSVTATRSRCTEGSLYSASPRHLRLYSKLLSPGRRHYRKLINNHCRALSAFPKCEFMSPDPWPPPESEDLVSNRVACPEHLPTRRGLGITNILGE